MAWRQGEIWLDTELRWFNERSGMRTPLLLQASSVLGLGPNGALAVTVPNGLAASRRRRAELRRMRSARRTRAVALVIGPATMLTFAGQRLGVGQSAGRILDEDPPSLVSGYPAAAGDTARVDSTKPSRAGRTQSAPATAARAAAIDWHRATSHGLPYSGWLSAGTQLPVDGPNWVTWNPIDDTVPNLPYRLYGNEHTIRRLVSVIAAYREANPNAPRVVVGDISLTHGGPMQEHRSHQNGLDVDVYYPRLDRALRSPTSTHQIDRGLAQELLDRFVAAGAQMIFVGYSTGLRGPSGVVIPYPNHENHMHVRFPPPS